MYVIHWFWTVNACIKTKRISYVYIKEYVCIYIYIYTYMSICISTFNWLGPAKPAVIRIANTGLEHVVPGKMFDGHICRWNIHWYSKHPFVDETLMIETFIYQLFQLEPQDLFSRDLGGGLHIHLTQGQNKVGWHPKKEWFNGKINRKLCLLQWEK